MILHLLTEEKFTDYAIAQFSAPEINSEFILIPSNNEMEHVKLIDKCTIVRQGSSEFKELLNHLGDYTGIILHGMHWGGWQKVILQKVPEHVKVAWYFWGGEIYGRSDVHINQFAPITKLVVNVRGFKKFFTNSKKNTDWELPYELYKRIDYCLTGEQEEYEYAKAFLQNNMKFLWYTCYDIDAMLGQLKDASCDGNNVIVGNSATETCNFFDVIPRLRGALNPDQKVVLPLSYGAPWITNAVSKYAKFFLGNAAMPLLDFMPRDEYNKILQSCSVMIMDQYIPQAQGNILTGLWLGMRVYMSEKSIAFKFFNRLGFKVFSFESEFKKYGLRSLSEEDIAVNRKVMMEWYSQEHVMQSAKNVVNILEGGMINKILILGAGEGQIPLILRAKDAGWHTIVVSPKGDYPGFELADEIAYCNIADIDAVVELAKTMQVQAITTDQTDIPMMAIQRVAKEMGIPAIHCEDINNFRYKSRMRELCQSAGIKTIPYVVTNDIHAVKYFFEQQVGSVIIKPVDSQGSRGVTQVKKLAELREAFDKALSYSKEKKVIVEQFIDGQEVEVDTVTYRDEIKAVLIGDVFNFESIQIFSAYERIYPSQLPTTTQDEIRRVNAQTLKVLGLHTGWTHGEYMVANNGDVYLLEVGARGGGNYIGSDIVKTMIGVSTDEMAFRTAIGDESFYSEVGLTNKCCAYKCFCLPEGTISAINIDEAWLNSDIVLRHNLEGLHVGKVCHRTTDKTTRYTVIVVADNHAQLRTIMDDIPSHISIEVTYDEGKKGCIWQ